MTVKSRLRWLIVVIVAATLLVVGYAWTVVVGSNWDYERHVHPERYYTECCDCGFDMGSKHSVPCRGCGSTKRCKP